MSDFSAFPEYEFGPANILDCLAGPGRTQNETVEMC